MALNNIKQTIHQSTHISFESLAGNQQNLLSKYIWWVAGMELAQ